LEERGGDSNNAQGQAHTLHILHLFWTQVSLGLGNRMSRLLRFEAGRLKGEVAAMYPALRAATLDMLNELGEDVHKDRMDDDATGGGMGTGILGGSALLDQDTGCSWTSASESFTGGPSIVAPRISADSWTVDPYSGFNPSDTEDGRTSDRATSSSRTIGGRSSSTSSSLLRFEWKIFVGEYGNQHQSNTSIGLSDLQAAFIDTSSQRLCTTLAQLFTPDNSASLVGMDAATDGMAGYNTETSALPTLPTRYDLAKIESLIKEELALADPRQGGGEFGMIKLLCDQVVDMIVQFCAAALDATSGAAHNIGSDDAVGDTYLRDDDWGPTESLSHDVKLAAVMVRRRPL
jgi:hypothetical protein